MERTSILSCVSKNTLKSRRKERRVLSSTKDWDDDFFQLSHTVCMTKLKKIPSTNQWFCELVYSVTPNKSLLQNVKTISHVATEM